MAEYEPMTHGDILALATPRQRSKTGIYFLIQGDKVVYVGQARNIDYRISQHAEFIKEFDSWSYVECRMDEMDELERYYQQYLQPEFNGPKSHKCTAVRTPYGDFPSIARAAEAAGIPYEIACRKVRNKKEGWCYLDKPLPKIMTRLPGLGPCRGSAKKRQDREARLAEAGE